MMLLWCNKRELVSASASPFLSSPLPLLSSLLFRHLIESFCVHCLLLQLPVLCACQPASNSGQAV